jgi:hypothetical protein
MDHAGLVLLRLILSYAVRPSPFLLLDDRCFLFIDPGNSLISESWQGVIFFHVGAHIGRVFNELSFP